MLRCLSHVRKKLPEKMKRVVVIGAGVVGITQAFTLAEKHQVSLVADKFSIDTNSVKATAMWHIFLTKIDPKRLRGTGTHQG